MKKTINIFKILYEILNKNEFEKMICDLVLYILYRKKKNNILENGIIATIDWNMYLNGIAIEYNIINTHVEKEHALYSLLNERIIGIHLFIPYILIENNDDLQFSTLTNNIKNEMIKNIIESFQKKITSYSKKIKKNKSDIIIYKKISYQPFRMEILFLREQIDEKIIRNNISIIKQFIYSMFFVYKNFCIPIGNIMEINGRNICISVSFDYTQIMSNNLLTIAITSNDDMNNELKKIFDDNIIFDMNKVINNNTLYKEIISIVMKYIFKNILKTKKRRY